MTFISIQFFQINNINLSKNEKTSTSNNKYNFIILSIIIFT